MKNSFNLIRKCTKNAPILCFVPPTLFVPLHFEDSVVSLVFKTCCAWKYANMWVSINLRIGIRHICVVFMWFYVTARIGIKVKLYIYVENKYASLIHVNLRTG